MSCESEIIEILASGDWNSMSQAWQADGTVKITVLSKPPLRIFKATVSGLYTPDMVILSCEVEA